MMREFHMWGNLDSDIPIIGQKSDGDKLYYTGNESALNKLFNLGLSQSSQVQSWTRHYMVATTRRLISSLI